MRKLLRITDNWSPLETYYGRRQVFFYIADRNMLKYIEVDVMRYRCLYIILARSWNAINVNAYR